MREKERKLILSMALPPKRQTAMILGTVFLIILLSAISFSPGFSRLISSLLSSKPEYVIPVTKLMLLAAVSFLCYTFIDPISAFLIARRCCKRLEEKKLLSQAAKELSQALGESQEDVLVTPHFLFSVGSGVALHHSDVIWCYDRNQSLFLSPMREVLMVGTSWGKEWLLTMDRKGKNCTGHIGDVMEKILVYLPELPYGYSKLNRNNYKNQVKKNTEKR